MKKIVISVFLFLPFFVSAALVDINTAGIEELKSITGVGDVIANNIILYRNTNGPFKKIEDLINVSRIGEVTFAKMKNQVTVGSAGHVGVDNQSSLSDEVKEDEDGDLVANSSQTEISDYKNESFKIGIGKERLATVRTPIIFSVSQNKKGKMESSFNWSFGDGTSAYGARVTHAYQYPGYYNVVLNGSIDQDEESVARTKVLVVEAQIKITKIDPDQGYVEIANNSDKEQNLNGWKLRLDNQSYTFPTDTIISPKSKIKIPIYYLGFNLSQMSDISLTYPDGGIVSKAVLREGIDLAQVAEMEKKLSSLKQQLASAPVASTVQARALPNQNLAGVKNSQLVSNMVTLKRELSWFEKIKHAIFK